MRNYLLSGKQIVGAMLSSTVFQFLVVTGSFPTKLIVFIKGYSVYYFILSRHCELTLLWSINILIGTFSYFLGNGLKNFEKLA